MPLVKNLRTSRVVEVNDDHWALTSVGFERVEDETPPPPPAAVAAPESEPKPKKSPAKRR